MSELGAVRWMRAGLVALAAAGACAALAPGAEAYGCRQVKAVDEPPCNPALPDSPWGASHRNSYTQASSPYRGLESANVVAQHLDLPGIPVQIQFTNRYRDGGVAAWGSLINSQDTRAVFKVDTRSGRVIDLYVPAEREANPPKPEGGGITGSYNILDRDGNFIVPRQKSIDVFSDSVRGSRGSKIRLVRRFSVPRRAFCRDDDRIAGATMTYDGYIAFATEQGMAGTLPRQPARMSDGTLRVLSFNGAKCRDASPKESLEEVSNSLAADEDGGIYIVTSKRMHRVDHAARGNRLTSAWSVPYEAGSGQSEIRLGRGSGSTPDVVGTGEQRDRFVAITDGQDLMHLDLFWRDGIPRDWKGLGKGRSRRQACEYPVRFGDPNAKFSLSEQSLTVRGYATFHVNNYLTYDFPDNVTGVLRNALAALRGGDAKVAPHGAERIDWNPRTRKCQSKWVNRSVSIPNAIPSMSVPSNLAYGIGQRNGFWGVEAMDWKTGKSKFFARANPAPCSDKVREYLTVGGVLGVFAPVLAELPRSCENSFYAATEVGPGGAIYTGTFIGMTIYRPRR